MDSKMVMVIDDEADTRVSLFSLFRAEGHRVTTFQNPHEALTMVHEIKPDVIFLDVQMPRVNGIEFLADLRMAAPDAPVVILTADENVDLIRQAQENGAREMMRKPFTPRLLLKALDRILCEKTPEPMPI